MSEVVKALEELKKSLGKVEAIPRKLTDASVWGIMQNRHWSPTGRCYGCNSNPGRTSQQWALFQHQQNYWICGNCINKTVDKIYTQAKQSGKCHRCRTHTNGKGRIWPNVGWVICENCAYTGGLSGEKVAAKIDAQLKSEKKKVTDMANKEKTIEEAAIPYINSGLAEPFAIAIARDVSLIDQILDLWEQDWWKQYPPEDILVCAVLNGELSEDDGRWLNEIRSDHERLALSCVTKEIELDWARALLGAGYLDHPEAVPDVLDGGHPVAIARIRKIKVDAALLPPQLGFKLSKSSSKKKTNGQSIAKVSHVEIEKVLRQLSESELKNITKGYLKTSQGKDWKIDWIIFAWKRINSRNFPASEGKPSLRRLADDIQLQGRSSLNTNELRESMKKLRGALRTRISSMMKKRGLTFD